MVTIKRAIKSLDTDEKDEISPQGRIIAVELWAVLFLASFVLVLCSLVSYSPNDAQVYYQGQSAPLQNIIGPGGVVLSGFLLEFFGALAYLLPLGLLFLGVACFKTQIARFSALRICGSLLGFLSTAILLSLLDTNIITFSSSFPLGGVLGGFFTNYLQNVISLMGTLVIAITGVLASVLLVFQRSLVGPVKFVLAIPVFLGNFASYLWGKLHKIRLPKFSKKAKPIIEKYNFNIGALAAKKIEVEAEEEKKEFSLGAISKLPVENKPVFLSVIDERPQAKNSSADPKIVALDNTAGQQAVFEAEKQKTQKIQSYELPPIGLLDYDAPEKIKIDEDSMRAQAEKLKHTFANFGIEGQIREIRLGPVVTSFEFVPAPGIKLSRIAALADDIAMAMAAVHVRVVAPIPGKGAVGIELPNDVRETVYLKEIVADQRYRDNKKMLAMALGKDIHGKPMFANLAEMPHLLIAGTTGSGKSVSVNAMICSILYRATPNDVKFLMIDPKMLELSIYEGIPHLLLPPIIDSKKAANAFKWAVREMEKRYLLMNETGVRDLEGYNKKVATWESENSKKLLRRDGTNFEKLPLIVIVVDEYADLVAIAGKEVEGLLMRLAQKARACSIHVILATQRPSVDIITGVIKANFPVRMGFRLASGHDSKTIINKPGAEKLLGRGDMLLMPPGSSDLQRIHGAFISETELHRVIKFWKGQDQPDYQMDIVEADDEEETSSEGSSKKCEDEKYDEAVRIVLETGKCSTSWLQRQLGVGYNRAARLVEALEKVGVVGPILSAKGDRKILGSD